MVRAWIERLRQRWPVATVLAAALAVLSYQYFTTLHHRNFDEPRGQGDYRPYLAVQDGHKIYLQVMSVVLDGELDISDEVEAFGYPGYRWQTDDGRPYYPHAFGPVIAWAPAFAIAHGASKVANLFGADIPSHGYTLFHQRVVYFTSVLFAWLTALIGYRCARRLLGGTWIPLIAALGILFGTNLSYYAVQRPDYAHALSAFVCALFLSRWVTSIGELRWRRFVLLGVLLGAATLVRIASLFLGIAVAVELAMLLARAPAGTRLRRAAELGARGAATLGVALVVFVPQLVVWAVHYESGLLSPPQGADYVHLGRPMLTEFLFSSQNGFLSTHPLSYAAVVGLVAAPRRLRITAAGLFAALAITAYVNSCVYDWWAMASYGARRMCCISLALVIGLAVLMAGANRLAARARIPRWGRRALAVIAVGWFVIWSQAYAERARNRSHSWALKMCCEDVPGFMAAIAEPIHERIGNPFALPASWLWSLRWDVPVERFDEVVIATYAARPTANDLIYGNPGGRMYPWNIPGVNFTPWLGRGFGPRQRYRDEQAGKRRPYRWTTRRDASIFVPLFLHSDHRFEVPVRPNLAPGDAPVRVRLRWNRDRIVYDEMLGPGWTPARFEVPAAEVNQGTNMLELIAEPGPFRATGPPALEPPEGDARRPIGLAVRMMKIWIDDPAR